MSSALLPLRGVMLIVSRPALWGRIVLAGACFGGTLLLACGLAAWVAWPSASSFWGWFFAIMTLLFALLLAASVVVMLVMPLLNALLLDAVARSVLRSSGITTKEPPLRESLRDTLALLVRTLPLRLSAAALAFGCGLVFAPLGAAIALLSTSWIGWIDAWDTVCGQRGLTGVARRTALSRRPLRPALGAALLLVLLAPLWLAFVLWSPALVAAAALAQAEEADA